MSRLGRAAALTVLLTACSDNCGAADDAATAAATIEAEALVALDCGFSIEVCRPSKADSHAAKLAGPLTLLVEIRLDGRPSDHAPAVTRWHTATDNRAYELGIDDLQRPYLALSADGKDAQTRATSISAPQQLRIGETYEVAAVIVPGREVAIYVNGIEVHRQSEVVPAVHVGAAPLGVRRREREEAPSAEVIVGRVRIFGRELAAAEILEVATEHGRRAALPGPQADVLEAAAVVSIDCGFTTDHCRPTPADSKAALLTGPFTLVAEVRLDGRPEGRAPVLTRWVDHHDNRAWELGIDERQRPYVALSDDGKRDRNLSGFVRAAQEIRLGATHELAAVIVPGSEVVMYLDGIEIHRQQQVVGEIHPGTASLGVRRRTADEEPSIDVIVGRARIFAQALTAADIVELATAHGRRAALSTLPPIRALTTGPRFHWFGYYDKHEFDPTDRYVLGMAVDFENRLVTPVDTVEIGMVDLQANDEWVRLGESRAWNWQQGCMLQWIPGTRDEIVWNDRIGEGESARFVARVLDVGSRTERLLPRPIYTLTPDGTRALSIDFERLGRWRPTYGYVGVPDRTEGVGAPTDAGIYSMDMTTGDSALIVSVAEIVAHGNPAGTQPEQEHFVEMLQINDAGTRFLFYERWVLGRKNLEHRVFTANLDGSDLFMASHKGMLSHVDWLDDDHFVIFSGSYGGYVVFEDKVGYDSMLLRTGADGHQTFLRSGAWMLSDTYADRYRLQHPFLFHLPTSEVFALADLFSPPEYKGIFRADTHPRLSRDERRVVLDSPHFGGRQMYLIEIGDILDGLALD